MLVAALLFLLLLLVAFRHDLSLPVGRVPAWCWVRIASLIYPRSAAARRSGAPVYSPLRGGRKCAEVRSEEGSCGVSGF